MISPLTYHASQARIDDLHRQSAELQKLERESKGSLRTRLSGLVESRRSKAGRAPAWQPAAKKA
jgi:hypothetical protein